MDFMNSLSEQLMEEVKTVFEEKGELTTSILSALLFTFENCAVEALDIVDRRGVTHIFSPSGRELFQVEGKHKTQYLCLRHSNYCSCPAFKFVVLKKDQPMCKHKLAVSLSHAMGLCKDLQYSDETVALMLQELQ